MGRTAITESSVREAMGRGLNTLEIPGDAIVTAAAAELAVSRNFVLRRIDIKAPAPISGTVQTPSTAPAVGARPVVFGSDHGGYQYKAVLMAYAASLGYATIDAGTKDEQPCDYPDYAYAVARMVASGNARCGIMIDGAGIGSCMVVNKVPGILGACCHNEFTARNAREHNNANVLTLGSRVLGIEVCKSIVKLFLETPFAGGRHENRVTKILKVENAPKS
jgi:ribose 5-phosphate isomerase B